MQYNLISDLNPTQTINGSDRGLHYGDGIFETMLLAEGKIHFWDQHYQRLQASAFRLSIPCPDQSWFDLQLNPYIELQQTLVIKLILTRGNGGRGLHLPEAMTPNIYLFKYVHKIIDKQSLKLYFSEITLPKNINLAGLKHLNRLDYVLATQELKNKPTYDEALLQDSDGHVIESVIHNLFFVLDNQVCTPDLSLSGVDGVMRQMIIKTLKDKGKNVKIGHFTQTHLQSASECFLCNSVQGIRPVIQIEEKTYGIGPITQELQNYFNVACH